MKGGKKGRKLASGVLKSWYAILQSPGKVRALMDWYLEGGRKKGRKEK
jgi:hypothetical protein